MGGAVWGCLSIGASIPNIYSGRPAPQRNHLGATHNFSVAPAGSPLGAHFHSSEKALAVPLIDPLDPLDSTIIIIVIIPPYTNWRHTSALSSWPCLLLRDGRSSPHVALHNLPRPVAQVQVPTVRDAYVLSTMHQEAQEMVILQRRARPDRLPRTLEAQDRRRH